MGLFGGASSKQIDEFAKQLARELAAACPLSKEQPGRPQATPKQLWSALEAVCGKALEFRKEHKLGIYKKARLGNTFRWELTEMGYDKAFAEDATQRLIVRIARK